MRVSEHARRNRKQPPPRRGVVILEFILAAPLFFWATLAIFEFGFLGLALNTGHTSLIEATRRAAELYPPMYQLDIPGGDNDIADQVLEFAQQHLAVQCIELPDMDNGIADTMNANALLVIQRRVGNGMVQTAYRGDMTVPCVTPPDMAVGEDEVIVTLCFPIVDSTDPSGCGNPVPDWLAPFGFSLDGCTFQVSSRMLLE